MTSKNISKIEELIKELLIQIGEDPDREGILRTPKRVAKAWGFLAKGYNQNLDNIINNLVESSLPGCLPRGNNEFNKQGFNTFFIGGCDYAS